MGNRKSINVQNETDETESKINKNDTNEKKKKKTNLDNIGNDKINKEYSNFDYTNENRIKENLSVPRKSNRKRSPVNRYGNPVTHFIYVNYIDANVPSTFEEANNSKENKNCQEAMNKNKT